MPKYRFLPDASDFDLPAIQLRGLQWTVDHAFKGNSGYRERLRSAGVEPGDITSLDQLTSLPFTSVEELRAEYPWPLLSVPHEDVVRIHASSGTTGKRKVLAYTAADIERWRFLFARCFELAGCTTSDRVHIAVGYGLWTAGAGFQLGCETFGATAIPLGPANIDMHLDLLLDTEATVLCATASMALLLAEEVEKRGLTKKIKLKRAIFGAEPHSRKMRARFEHLLGLKDSFDITGLTELYGPGMGLECHLHTGIHYHADAFILEVLDPVSLKPVAEGEIGEMVVTTLSKQAAPLIRYRTRDLTRLLPGTCACGCPLPRHDAILGRSDDMIIFRGVNIYPGQVAAVFGRFAELGTEYMIKLFRHDGREHIHLQVERREGASADNDLTLASAVGAALHKALLTRIHVEIIEPGTLPRTASKSKRVVDERE